MNQHMPCKGYGNNSPHAVGGSGMEPGRFGAVLGKGSARFVCHARSKGLMREVSMAKHKDKGRFRLIRGGKIPNKYPEGSKIPFEYDPRKSELNLEKHGIDFEEAQMLWDDPRRLEMFSEYKGEYRLAVIGHLSDGLWVAIATRRGEKVRIISVRKATRKEVAFYDREVYRIGV